MATESNLPEAITGSIPADRALEQSGAADQIQQQGKVSSVLTAQQVLNIMSQSGVAPSFGAYHASFQTGNLFSTGACVVSEFKMGDDVEEPRVYNKRQYKFWATPFGYVPGTDTDYRTGNKVMTPASFEIFVDIDKAHLIKPGFKPQGFVISARNSEVAAYDYITPEDAQPMLEYLGIGFNELPKVTCVEKDKSGLSRDEARAARRDADDISNGNSHYVVARGRTAQVAEVLDVAGATAETQKVQAESRLVTAQAVEAETKSGSSFSARLRNRRR